MKTKTILFFGIVFMAAVSLPVFAHGPGWGNASRGNGYNNDCPYSGYGGENLTQEQRLELNALRDEYRANTDKIRDQLRDKRYSMQTELNREQSDELKVRALQSEISELMSQMDSARIDHMLKAKKVDHDISSRSFRNGGHYRGDRCYGRSRDIQPEETF